MTVLHQFDSPCIVLFIYCFSPDNTHSQAVNPEWQLASPPSRPEPAWWVSWFNPTTMTKYTKKRPSVPGSREAEGAMERWHRGSRWQSMDENGPGSKCMARVVEAICQQWHERLRWWWWWWTLGISIILHAHDFPLLEQYFKCPYF